MKTKLIINSVVAAAFLAAAMPGWAMPPIQHPASGVIVAIDYASHTLTLARSQNHKPQVFVWNDSTRFREHGKRICSGMLEPGQSVKLYYRREIGQLVPREVNLRRETTTTCKCCE
jgi:hypothetical protein